MHYDTKTMAAEAYTHDEEVGLARACYSKEHLSASPTFSLKYEVCYVTYTYACMTQFLSPFIFPLPENVSEAFLSVVCWYVFVTIGFG